MTLANGREYLAIPGPSVIPDRVLQAMHRPSPNIYEGELIEMTAGVKEDLKAVAGTKHDVAIYIGNGHAAWEAALAMRSRNEFALLAPGREEGESAIVHLVGGSPVGWGFTTSTIDATGEWLDAVEPQPPSSTLDAIVNHALEGMAKRDKEFRSLRVLRREAIDGDQFRWVTGDPTAVG